MSTTTSRPLNRILAVDNQSVVYFNGKTYIGANRAAQGFLEELNEVTGTITDRQVKDDPRIRAYAVRAQKRQESTGFSGFKEFHDLVLDVFGVEVEIRGGALVVLGEGEDDA